jgi:hypothetical protein
MQRIMRGQPGRLRRLVDTEEEHRAEQVQQLVLVLAMPQTDTAWSCAARTVPSGGGSIPSDAA